MPRLNDESLAAILAQPHPDGGFDRTVQEHLRQLGERRPAVVLAFPPKAAGTYLRAAIIYAVKGQLVRTVHALGGRDATPYLPTFVDYFLGGVTPSTLVTHVHMQALTANISFLETFGLRPIVMLRNIPDMLASYWDMLETDPAALEIGLNCLIPEDFGDMSRQTKADFLVDVLGPWYASFYATWIRYREREPSRVCLLKYRQLCDEPVESLTRALSHVGLPCSQGDCRLALDRAWAQRAKLRFNKGEEGRASSYFSTAHIDRLARMLGAYRQLVPYLDELLIAKPRVPNEQRLRAWDGMAERRVGP